MKKRAFPKELKFGTYLPSSSSKRLIKINDASWALERFIREYFEGVANIEANLNTAYADSLFISDEHTAYLFRSVMEAIYGGDIIDISLANTERALTISFSTGGKYKTDDTEIYERLLKLSEEAGFELIFTGSGIALRAPVLRRKIVISAITKESFYEKLVRIFLTNQSEISKQD